MIFYSTVSGNVYTTGLVNFLPTGTRDILELDVLPSCWLLLPPFKILFYLISLENVFYFNYLVDLFYLIVSLFILLEKVFLLIIVLAKLFFWILILLLLLLLLLVLLILLMLLLLLLVLLLLLLNELSRLYFDLYENYFSSVKFKSLELVSDSSAIMLPFLRLFLSFFN